MMKRACAIGVLTTLLLPLFVRADIKPAALFSDHMVLQQGTTVPVWGWADVGEQVTVAIGDQKQTATAGSDKKWMIKLTDLKAGGPTEMTISGTPATGADAKPDSITITDVLIGEVWVGSGQSNMTFPVSKSKGSYAGLINEQQEIAAANYPQIRMFTPKPAKAYEPQTDLAGQWQVCSPQTVPGFSAVGYLFARDLQREIKAPIGIVTLAFGASTIDAWISREALSADPALKPTLDGFDASVQFFRANPAAPASAAPPIPWPINKPRSASGKQKNPVQDQHEPTVLFNGLTNPAIPYAMRGVIWYQGESIVGGDAGLSRYPQLQATLIQDWRKRWGEGDFPFFIVQLPALQNISNNPRVREGQATVLSLPNTAMAVTIDIGDPNDVHPHNKAPLGERLTRIALANVYGQKIEFSGPVYDSMTIDGATIRVKFTHIGGGLVARDGPLKWFQIAGDDRQFVAADAIIDGDSVVVSSPQVKSPVAVRYAWDDYPAGCNLYNCYTPGSSDGLPAAPFRTDRWAFPIVGLVN
jgi:sialate O-acetylesterase